MNKMSVSHLDYEKSKINVIDKISRYKNTVNS